MEKDNASVTKLIVLAKKSGDKELQKAAKEAEAYMKKVEAALGRIEGKLSNIETMQKFFSKLGK